MNRRNSCSRPRFAAGVLDAGRFARALAQARARPTSTGSSSTARDRRPPVPPSLAGSDRAADPRVRGADRHHRQRHQAPRAAVHHQGLGRPDRRLLRLRRLHDASSTRRRSSRRRSGPPRSTASSPTPSSPTPPGMTGTTSSPAPARSRRSAATYSDRVAITSEAQVLVYRTDVLEAAGVAVPTTFDELLAACAAIKEKGGGVLPDHAARRRRQLVAALRRRPLLSAATT